MIEQPVRVLHVIDTLGHGGAEHQLSLLVRSLDRGRFENTVCHVLPDRTLADEIRSVGVPVFALSPARGRSAVVRAALPLMRLVREVRPHLIHTSLFGADMLGGWVGRRLRIPVVTTLCSMWGQEQASNGVRDGLMLAARASLWRHHLRAPSTHVIAISQAVRRNAEVAFGLDPGRVTVIYRAFEEASPSAFPPRDLRDELGVASTVPVFLNVGRLVPSKGQDVLIRSMRQVVAALPDAVLVIAGEGWFRAELQKEIAAAGVEAHVHLLGERTDVAALIRSATAFVFPSRSEGLGVALVEAAGRGAACITTAIPPMTEVVEHERSGLCVPPGDVEALAAAMIRLGRAPEETARLGRAAADRAARLFSREAIVAEVERVYMRAIGRGAS